MNLIFSAIGLRKCSDILFGVCGRINISIFGFSKTQGTEELIPHERRFYKKDGTTIPFLMSDKLIFNERGDITGIRTAVQSIAERKETEKALVASEEKYRLLGNGILHQIWTATPNGRIDYVNQRIIDFFGLPADKFIDNINENITNLIHPDDYYIARKKWFRAIKNGSDFSFEYRLLGRDGKYVWFQGVATAARDEEGHIISWFGTSTNIDDRKKAESQLTYLVGHDTLTGLSNRVEFMNHLERAIVQSKADPDYTFAVLFLDLDRFKIINDSLGHQIGDKLLIEITKRLKSCLRQNDIVARLGGDEFTVLLTNIRDRENVVNIAERFLNSLANPFQIDTYEVFTSASIGIVILDEINRLPEDFLRDADTAMYRAKASGKNRFEIFDREMQIRTMNLLRVENDLRRAIERDEFRVFYNPLLN